MTAKSIADILDAAADLIEPEGAWTQGTIFRDASGEAAGAAEGEAVCWCAVGAIIHLRSGFNENALRAVEKDLPETEGRFFGLRPLSEWNDAPERTQAEVVARFRETANALRTSTPGEA